MRVGDLWRSEQLAGQNLIEGFQIAGGDLYDHVGCACELLALQDFIDATEPLPECICGSR